MAQASWPCVAANNATADAAARAQAADAAVADATARAQASLETCMGLAAQTMELVRNAAGQNQAPLQPMIIQPATSQPAKVLKLDKRQWVKLQAFCCVATCEEVPSFWRAAVGLRSRNSQRGLHKNSMAEWSAEIGCPVQATRMRLSNQQIKDRLEIRPFPAGRCIVYRDLMR